VRRKLANPLPSARPGPRLSSAGVGQGNCADKTLELVDEIVEPTIDLNALHDVVARLLIQYHHTQRTKLDR